jgi:hypothetical protein
MMKRIAKEVPLAFVLIPDEFQVEDDVWDEVVRRSDRPLDRDTAQRVLDRVLREAGWGVLDLLPILRAVPPMEDGRRHLYHLRDTHFNARGNEAAGRALAGFVDSLLSAPVTAPPAGGAPLPGAALPPIAVKPPPPPVTLPLAVAFTDNAALGWMESGWQNPELEGRPHVWSDGTESVLAMPLPTGGDVRLDFEVLPFMFPRNPRQRITVVLNGVELEEIALRNEVGKYSVTLPAAQLRPGLDLITFRYAYARSPKDVLSGSPDVRLLAVAWYGMSFTAK